MATNRKARTKPSDEDMDAMKVADVSAQVDHIVEAHVATITDDHALELITLDEYITRHTPHNGLVASFTYEATQDEKGLAPRTEAAWANDFEKQAMRVYKSF